MLNSFDRLVAIDWSGAKGPPLPGLQVAESHAGSSAPILISNQIAGNWRRSDLAQWISRQMAGSERLLLGFDFGFAYPYCDASAYFPGHLCCPKNAPGLWASVDKICAVDKEFYGGLFYKKETAPYADYLCYQTYTGAKFDNSRLRVTEERCVEVATRPSCMFKCVGPDSVGIGSVAGMRFLHQLKTTYRDRLAIWPFDDISNAHSVVVEIFPRLFFHLANNNPQLWQERTVLNSTLAFYRASQLSPTTVIDTEDKADAIISSAALRSFAQETKCWSPQQMSEEARTREGWIFGVR